MASILSRPQCVKGLSNPYGLGIGRNVRARVHCDSKPQQTGFYLDHNMTFLILPRKCQYSALNEANILLEVRADSRTTPIVVPLTTKSVTSPCLSPRDAQRLPRLYLGVHIC